MNRLLLNWKTTSAGLLSVAGGLVRIGFAVANKNVNEEAVMTAIAAIVAGLGLLFARDATTTSVDMGLQDVETKAQAKEVVTPKDT